jgi:hypothetical protein
MLDRTTRMSCAMASYPVVPSANALLRSSKARLESGQ